jgi:hypothetical protein
MNSLLKKAEKAGWRLQPTGSGHIKCFSPDKKTISLVSASPRSDRAVIAASKIFKEGGLDID